MFYDLDDMTLVYGNDTLLVKAMEIMVCSKQTPYSFIENM